MTRLTDFEALLSGPISKTVIDNIVHSVVHHPEDLPQLYGLVHSDNEKASWRSLWACEKLCEIAPELFMGKRVELMEYAMSISHQGKKRLALSILYNLPLREVFTVHFLNACMEWMFAPKESIAVQALSIRLAHRMCEYEQELMPELQLYLENAETEYMSAGVRSVVKSTLKKINKEKNKTR